MDIDDPAAIGLYDRCRNPLEISGERDEIDCVPLENGRQARTIVGGIERFCWNAGVARSPERAGRGVVRRDDRERGGRALALPRKEIDDCLKVRATPKRALRYALTSGDFIAAKAAQ